jgi:hypothetical protein
MGKILQQLVTIGDYESLYRVIMGKKHLPTGGFRNHPQYDPSERPTLVPKVPKSCATHGLLLGNETP